MADEQTLDQLADIPTDPEAERKVQQSTLLPVGTYNSVPELALRVRTGGDESKNPGRVVISYWGHFKGVKDVAGKEGTSGFAIAYGPENFRYKDDGKADLPTKLFNQAKKTYCRAMALPEDSVVGTKAVVEFVQKYSVGVRFILGDDDNIGVSITTAVETV